MKTSKHAKEASRTRDWHKADIKAALEKAGWSLRRLAAHHGYTGAMLTKALRQPYPHAERIIAEAIGEDPKNIWPSRYSSRLSRKRGSSAHPKNTTHPALSRNQKDGECK